jgi:hypothetical protein
MGSVVPSEMDVAVFRSTDVACEVEAVGAECDAAVVATASGLGGAIMRWPSRHSSLQRHEAIRTRSSI